MAEKITTYYSYVLALTIILLLFGLALGPLAPIDEPTYFPGYDLQIPVGLSFSGFILLIIFIISVILFWGSKNIFLNVLIDASSLSFSIVNYINFYLVYVIWKPIMYLLPFFFYIRYDGISTLVFDFGQIALIIFFYRLYKNIKTRRTYKSV
ncbi:hypothetical protein [Sulfurisphaera tokodaii]|uniref:Uncharacterized protein n=2 Tax=Sulfurisphaera tokodaii TaxID=111955 RepID=Q96XY7_SULTO|nr:hypothetical protein [Sulfurisphaera tokodaii]BAB67490.1 hypothetical protein STK_23810 [Sulfurisphaera tokodaii str. 7]HII75200.1 hypothetical protein [Sulfurisphaera tokodaii]